jgi:GntR family transcriptional regulator
MQIAVNPADELPIYRQIMRQITESVAGGRLRPGDKLTSHRDLAEQLVIAPLTVKKAYDELERLGLIETQRGRGTFVSATPPATNHHEQRERLRESARRLLAQAYLGGLGFEEVLQALAEANEQIRNGRTHSEEQT